MEYPQYQDLSSIKEINNLTEIARKKYPTYAKGGKSEWIGMIQHQNLIKEELEKTEKGIRMLKLKTLMTEYERQQLVHLEKKQAELNEKKMDCDDVLQKKQLYDQQHMKYKEDAAFIKGKLAQNYSENILMQNEAKYFFKSQDAELERKILEENRRIMESEERKRNVKKEAEKKWVLEQIEANKQKKIDKKFEDEKFKFEANELQKQNAMKEITKEQNYKNFYKLCANNQMAFMEMHRSQVVNPRLEKQRNIDEMIEKNVNVERQRQIMGNLEQMMKKQKVLKNVNASNKNLITEHAQMKTEEKEERKGETIKRLEDISTYQEYLKFKKQEKSGQVSELKMILDKQNTEKEEKIINQHRMTKNEKKLNYLDLQAYKGLDPSLFSMIPGWSPQVGVIKPFQKIENYNLNESVVNLTNPNEDLNPSPSLSKNQPFFSPNSVVTNLAGNMNKGKFQPQFQSNLNSNFEVKSPLGLQTNLNAQIQNNIERTAVKYMNPKANNVLLGEGNSNNPYILREIQKRGNIFSKIGQNSLSK